MKIVYPICCGIDVHKSFLVATIVSVTELRTLNYKKERFSTFNKDLFRLKNWLIENNCFDVLPANTGFPYLTFWNQTCGLSSSIPSGLRPSRATRMT